MGRAEFEQEVESLAKCPMTDIKIGGCFASKLRVNEETIEIKLVEGKVLAEPVKVILWSKQRNQLVDLPFEIKDRNILLEVTLLESKISLELDKWEVFLLIQGDNKRLLRIEAECNIGMKRVRSGYKTLPRKNGVHTYDDSKRVMQPIDTTDRDKVLICRYTDEYQLLFQVIPRENAYENRYYVKMEEIFYENERVHVIVTSPHLSTGRKKLTIAHRDTGDLYELLPVEEEHNGNVFRGHYELDVSLVDFQPFFWDFLFWEEIGGDWYKFRLRNYEKRFYGDVWVRMDDYVLFSYYTQNDNIILYYRLADKYDKVEYRKRERRARMAYQILKPFLKGRKIVLLYEKFCKCAQDNGYFMFDYYMNKGRRKDRRRTYYIIDKSQPDYDHIKKYGRHVIEFMSFRHMLYIQAASLLVSTDTIKHAYQWRCPNSPIYEELLQKKSVFLQHGVLALKRVEYIYDKYGGNKTDLFISSSKMEQDIIVKNFRYNEGEVPITGLARWDGLRDQSSQRETRSILFMPTWRNWIIEVEDDKFKESKYFKEYNALIHSKKLQEILAENQVKMVFCMHPRFREYMHDFESDSPYVELFDYSTRPINELLMECSMMVTDYSSASWDAFYQKKPILFFQFDYEEYMEHQGSYIDMKTELFGRRVITEQQLIEAIEEQIKRGFKEEDQYGNLRGEYLPNLEGNHCQKIDGEIRKRNMSRLLGEKIRKKLKK